MNKAIQWIASILLLGIALAVSGSANAKTNQTITFGALPNQTYGASPFTVSAKASSGLTVTFSSSNTAVCTATGTNDATITIVGVGTCTINANQAGNGTYNAATQVSESFTVSPASQIITFAALYNKTFTTAPFAVSATASSSLTVTFTSGTTSVCTVSGTTVTMVSTGTCSIIANQAGNADYTAAAAVTQSFAINAFTCSPPSNVPSGVSVTCVCDTFDRASLNPSPNMFGANWVLSNSDGLGNPYINQTTGLLRLTESTNDNGKAATAPGIYPATNNYISVEFNHYAYNGTNPGADGLAVTLSNSTVAPQPGAVGGSQGYANNGSPGFAGGWVGVALDEYGNYSNPTEGRNGGPGFIAEQIGMRGPGTGTLGYDWISGSGSNPGGLSLDANTSTIPAPGYMYQVIVDARNESSGTVNISVNRDSTTMNGSNYVNVVAPVNAYTEAANAVTQGWISSVVPNYWQISFTSSTGGSYNTHEIGNLRICAQTVYPPSGQQASGFSAIDTGYGSSVPSYLAFATGDIYMKLVGTPFNLWIAALSSTGMATSYSATTNKYVLVNLVQNLGAAHCSPSTCDSTCTGQTAVESGGVVGTGGSQIASFPTSNTSGAVLSPSFTLNSAWQNLIAVMKECANSGCTSFTSTAPACSSDAFSVRPLSVATVATNATNTSTSGTPTFKAGSGVFTLTATTTGVAGKASGYTGMLRVNNSSIQPVSPATNPGLIETSPATTMITFPAATSGIGSSTTTGNFTYSEVGSFMLPGYVPSSPSTNTTNSVVRGVYDGVTTATDCSGNLATPACDLLKTTYTWTGVDSVSTKLDCDVDSYSNVMDANGKYGCNFGNLPVTAAPVTQRTLGRFIPDHFVVAGTTANRSDLSCTPTSSFTYMGEPVGASFTVTAQNASNVTTQNYTGANVQFNNSTLSWTSTGTDNSMGLWMAGSGMADGTGTCNAYFTNATPSVTSYSCTGVTAPASINRTAGPRADIVTPVATPVWSSGVGSFTTNLRLEKANSPDGPYASASGGGALYVGAAPIDNDGVTVLSSALNLATTASTPSDRVQIGTPVDMLFGRLWLTNAYGSTLVNLPVSMAVQYWNGSQYLTNKLDNCTSVPGVTIGMGNYGGGLSACKTAVPSSNVMSSGSVNMILPAPSPALTANGWVDLTANLATTTSASTCVAPLPTSSTTTSTSGLGYLSYPTSSNSSGNPSARVMFGVYSGSPAVIYLREIY